MTALWPIFAVIVAIPVGCAVFAAARWWRARRRMERHFREGRERRTNGMQP